MASEKFMRGEDMTAEELRELSLVDRVRYATSKYSKPEGWNAIEMDQKLLEIGAILHSDVLGVAEAAREFYG